MSGLLYTTAGGLSKKQEAGCTVEQVWTSLLRDLNNSFLVVHPIACLLYLLICLGSKQNIKYNNVIN